MREIASSYLILFIYTRMSGTLKLRGFSINQVKLAALGTFVSWATLRLSFPACGLPWPLIVG